MLDLPKSTEFNKRIPKQKFYENMYISPKLKKVFVEQVKIIYWRNKIATSTANLAEGTNVTELEVFEIKLNSQLLDEELLRQIDRVIPYHILFLLEYQGKYQAWIGYKEILISKNNSININDYYHTDWDDLENLSLKMEGLSIDKVYENYIRQIAGEKLKTIDTEETLKESIERNERHQFLQKQIDVLNVKMQKEKQLNRKMEMNTELKRLKKEITLL